MFFNLLLQLLQTVKVEALLSEVFEIQSVFSLFRGLSYELVDFYVLSFECD